MKPLYRFIGAKNWLGEPPHSSVFPDFSGVAVYREPFFGGGAVFWRVAVDSEAGRHGALPVALGDANPFVCDLLIALRDHPLELLAQIAMRPSTQETFEAAKGRLNSWITSWKRTKRTLERPALVPRAADFLAVMTLGFNGLWRVNKKGLINVPLGRTASGAPAKMPVRARVMEAHQALMRHRAIVWSEDFENQIDAVGPRDLVYLDPPYVESFTGYVAKGFSDDDGTQLSMAGAGRKGDLARLRDACEEIDRRGARFLLSNLDTPKVRKVFSGFTVQAVDVRHSVSCDADTRGKVGEVLIRNY